MEPSGRNQQQVLANGPAAKSVKTSEIRCRGLPPVATTPEWGHDGAIGVATQSQSRIRPSETAVGPRMAPWEGSRKGCGRACERGALTRRWKG
jgi:hypothetical protein